MFDNPYHSDEIEQKHHTFQFSQKLSTTAQKIASIASSSFFLHQHLFSYDKGILSLSPPFKSLLSLYIDAGALDPKILKAQNLHELNTILQKQQKDGGFMREKGKERWEIHYNDTIDAKRDEILFLQRKLGLVAPHQLNEKKTFDHCIVFGAKVARMIVRLKATAKALQNNVSISKKLTLLGSNRPLTPDEITLLNKQIEVLEEDKKDYWSNFFDEPSRYNEAHAFTCLWDCIIPKNIQDQTKDKVCTIESTKIGSSYGETKGNRVTTAITADDWIEKELLQDRHYSIFSVIEQPYLRLPSQFEWRIFQKDVHSSFDLITRVQNTALYFSTLSLPTYSTPYVLVDEIARNIFLFTKNIEWIDSLTL